MHRRALPVWWATVFNRHDGEELGKQWEMLVIYFRYEPAAIRYTPPRRSRRCVSRAAASPDQIERIDVATYRFASGDAQSRPENYLVRILAPPCGCGGGRAR